MKKADTDIDIDFLDRSKALEGLDYICASLIDDDGNVRPHNSGVYFQDIPYDPITSLASINSKEAEERGYFKIDFLNVSLYNGVKDESHLVELMETDPLWEMLDDEFFVKQLWHIHNHYELVNNMKPRSVEELAMLLGVIRPAKQHLQNEPWNEVAKEIWSKPQIGDENYKYKSSFFKKSHSFAYATAIVVQMNLITEKFR